MAPDDRRHLGVLAGRRFVMRAPVLRLIWELMETGVIRTGDLYPWLEVDDEQTGRILSWYCAKYDFDPRTVEEDDLEEEVWEELKHAVILACVDDLSTRIERWLRRNRLLNTSAPDHPPAPSSTTHQSNA